MRWFEWSEWPELTDEITVRLLPPVVMYHYPEPRGLQLTVGMRLLPRPRELEW